MEGLLRTSEGAKDGGLDWVRTGESEYVSNKNIKANTNMRECTHSHIAMDFNCHI